MDSYTSLILQLSSEQNATLLKSYATLSTFLERAVPIPKNFHHTLKQQLSIILRTQNSWTDLLEDFNSRHLLHLQHPDNRILNLPWELAIEDHPHVLLSKSTIALGATYSADNPLPLKILVMVASPENSIVRRRLSFEEEELEILRACGPLFETGQVHIDFTDDGSLANLRQKLQENYYHILHFSGHGIYHNGQGYLEMEDEYSLQSELISAKEFAETLIARPEHLPGLVLLSSCQTAQGGQDSNFSGVANELLRVKVPAIVAMGWSISDSYANYFSGYFYSALANRNGLPSAFQHAIFKIRLKQNQELAQLEIPGLAAQWLIPQLYCCGPMNNIVNLEKREKKLSITSANFKMHTHLKGYYFVGRRRDKRKLFPILFDKQPIWLHGQGGLGKSSLAEHLVQRLLAKDSQVYPFVLDEGKADILSLQKMLYDYFKNDRKRLTIEADAHRYSDKAPDQVLWLLEELSKSCKPVIVFDNIESLQIDDGNPEFAKQHQELQELIQSLVNKRLYYLIFTGRYTAPIALAEQVVLHPLQTVSFGDFWKKTQQLRLVTLRQSILQKPQITSTNAPPQPASYEDLIGWLYQTFGGNYRALEFFDEYFAQALDKTNELMSDLYQFPNLYAHEVKATLQRMSFNLVFNRLLALLSPSEQKTLGYLRCFRRAVLPLALGMQDDKLNCISALQRLQDLTLLEEHLLDNEEAMRVYYVPPLIKNLLNETMVEMPDFSELQAGAYFEYVGQEINQRDYIDLEEAFDHYLTANDIKGINRCGVILCNGYYNANLFAKALHFALTAYKRLGENTDWKITNRAGLTLELFGDYESALQMYQHNLELTRKIEDRQGESTTLNNLSIIHKVKGEFDRALLYLEQCLVINQETESYSAECSTLNNIGEIHRLKSDYDTALYYFEQSLTLGRKIEDDQSKGIALNNIGLIYFAKSDYDSALYYFEQSMVFIQKVEDRQVEAVNLTNIAEIYRIKGENDLALGYLEQGLKVQQQIGDIRGEITSFNNIAEIYRTKSNYDIAFYYYKKSLAIAQQTGDRQVEGAVLNNIGLIHTNGGKYDIALSYLEQSLDIRQQIGERKEEGTVLNNIAELHRLKGENDIALYYLKQSLDIALEIGDLKNKAGLYNNIALNYYAKGDYANALTYFEQSIDILDHIGDRSLITYSLHNAAIIYLNQKNNFKKYIEYEGLAYQAAQEIGDIKLIYTIGKYFGDELCERGAIEHGLPILENTYQVGQIANYSNLEELRALIRRYTQEKNKPPKRKKGWFG
ncbi:tetratricopeptide repeat protein [Haliscomenobacter sp.]|uniref:tetratricopeptide repeat protein n=1 Tax=Haliscomenobacter sp. TaxID=2717303 RepID=UPI003BA99FE7